MFLRRVYHYFFDLLTAKERRGFCVLMAMMLFGTILEVVAIGSIAPLITLLLHRGAIPENSPRWSRLAELLNYPSNGMFLLIAIGAVTAAFAIKNLYSAFRLWRQYRFFADLECRLSSELFAHYLDLPYSEHLQRNSSQMHSHVSEISNLMVSLTAVQLILTESLTLGGVFALLLYVEFWGTLTAGGLIAALILIFNFTLRREIARLGRERFGHLLAKNRECLQGLNGVKEIKLMGREKFFRDRFVEHSVALTRVMSRHQVLSVLPPILLELLALASLSVLIAVMIWQQKIALVPTLALYAAAMFRLLPAINRIIGNLQTLQFLADTVKKVGDEIREAGKTKKSMNSDGLSPLPFERKIIFEHVSFSYPSREQPALREISLTIAAKTAVGFIGGSGAGKSTLADLLIGLLTPAAGKIIIDDCPLTLTTEISRWQKQIGYVPQFIYLTDDTLRRNIAFGLPDEAIDEDAVKRAADTAQLGELIAELPNGLDTVVGERGTRLSGGQRQRVGIARALYGSPSVLVLDEATSALDLETEREIVEAIQRLRGKITTICIAHRFSTVARCDRIFRLEKGEISGEGTPAEFGIFPDSSLASSPKNEV